MRRRNLAALVVLLLMPGALAWGAAEVEADLELPRGVRLQGAMEATASSGLLDLAPALAQGPLEIEWDEAEGYRLVERRTRLEAPLVDYVDGKEEPVNESLHRSRATLRLTTCHEPCLLFLDVSGAGRIEVRGETPASLRWIPEERVYWVLSRNPAADDALQRPVAAGTVAMAREGTFPDATALIGPRFAVSGSAVLVAANVSGAIVRGAASEPFDLAPSRSAAADPAPSTLPYHRVAFPYALLRLEGARLVRGAEGALAFLESPELVVAGRLQAPEATGTFSADGERRTIEREPMTLAGTIRVSPRVELGGFAELASVGEAATLHARVSGQADVVVLGAERIGTPRESAVRMGWFTAAAAALLLALRFAPLHLLYTRLERDRVLMNENRLRIVQSLRDTPGLTGTALARGLGLARTVAIHHLRMLEAHGFVLTRRVGATARYYLPDDSGLAEQARRNHPLEDATRRIVAEAIVRGFATQAAIVETTGLGQRLVSYHLGRLHAAGFVEIRPGRPHRYEPTGLLFAARDGLTAS